MINTIIQAQTLDNLLQINLIKQVDLFGAISYNIHVLNGENIVHSEVLTDLDIATSVYEGLIKYYNSQS